MRSPNSDDYIEKINALQYRNTCKIADVCGGCIYQGIPYYEQILDKDKEILDLLKKHKIDESVYSGVVPAFTPYHYRNKMEYTFGDFEKGGDLTLGMHKKKHFMSIVTSDECQLVQEDFNSILRETLKFARERNYSFYNKKSHAGMLRNLLIRAGENTGEILINIVTSSEEGFAEDAFLCMINSISLDNKLVGVLRTFNDSLADAVIPERIKILQGRDYYNEEILGLKFKVNAFSFFQTNISAVERLYSDALSLVPNLEEKTVYDLYCGTGTISQLLALRAKSVYGIEIVRDSVSAAVDNAKLNGISNCKFICGDVKTKLEEIKEKPDIIVVDPPRVGMHDKVVDMLAGYGINEILYISCNPKTLCMNIERFAAWEYKPIIIRAYDNFPLTRHVETVCLMSKVAPSK